MSDISLLQAMLVAKAKSGGGSTLIEKSISANGVYNASEDSADGYSKVTVDVSGGDGNAKFVSNGYDFRYACLESVIIPEGIATISNQSFPNTMTFNYLKTIEIPSTVTSINSYAFSTGRMPNLEKIIINKPQDSISDAPWAAENATVIWTG